MCLCGHTVTHIQLLEKHQRFLWRWFSKHLMSFFEREVAAQCSSAVLNLSCSPTYEPSLQSQGHNVQFFNGSRPRHSGAPLCALPQCKHLIKIACAPTIAANAIREPQAFEVLPAKAGFLVWDNDMPWLLSLLYLFSGEAIMAPI